MYNPRFTVKFLEAAKEFLDNLDDKAREKIFYNIWKSRSVNDKKLFKKQVDKFGNLEPHTIKLHIDFLLFGTNPRIL